MPLVGIQFPSLFSNSIDQCRCNDDKLFDDHEVFLSCLTNNYLAFSFTEILWRLNLEIKYRLIFERKPERWFLFSNIQLQTRR